MESWGLSAGWEVDEVAGLDEVEVERAEEVLK